MVKINPGVKSSRQAPRKNKQQRHELTDDGEQSRSIRYFKHHINEDEMLSDVDEEEYAEIKRLLR